ncbi:MAG: DUF4258 domain-containing protein [Bacteroidetes bacterium]|nr:DUF4258 domain-containing protein [Bacteroidota bacterium]
MIAEIRQRISAGKFEFSKHATDQVVIRNITVEEICEAFASGEIIEDYPDDKYGPSCLIFGRTHRDRPIHIHCSYPTREYLKIITAYEPDPALWQDFRVRRIV